MPRTTRSKAAAAREAAEQQLLTREPFDEVDVNAEPTKKSTTTGRARSRKASSADDRENSDEAALANGTDNLLANDSASIESRSTRSTRSRSKAVAGNAIVDQVVEVDIYEVTIKRSTRSTRKAAQDDTLLKDASINILIPEPEPSEPKRRTRGSAKNPPIETAKEPVKRTRRQAAIVEENTDARLQGTLKATSSDQQVGRYIPSPRKSTTRIEVDRTSRNNSSPTHKTSTPFVSRNPPKSAVTTTRSPARAISRIETDVKTKLGNATPSRAAASTTPIAKRLAAFENNLTTTITPSRFSSNALPPKVHSNIVRTPAKDDTETVTPNRRVIPVSLRAIKSSQDIRSQTEKPSAPSFLTPKRGVGIDTKPKESDPLHRFAAKPIASVSQSPREVFVPANRATTKVPMTPGSIKKKPITLGSPFAKPTTAHRVASISVPLGSFASPTKAHLARQSVAHGTISSKTSQDEGEDDSGSSSGQSMAVNIHKKRVTMTPSKLSSEASVNPLQNKKPIAVPSVLRKQPPVVATTKAASLRAQKAGISPAIIPTVNTPGVKVAQKTTQPRVAEPSTATRTAFPDTKVVSQRTKKPVASTIIKSQPQSQVSTVIRAAEKPSQPFASPLRNNQINKERNSVATSRTFTKVAEASRTIGAQRPVAQPQTKSVPRQATAATTPSKIQDAEIRKVEAITSGPSKLVTQKKPFQPVKSSKPPTVPIPFQSTVISKPDAKIEPNKAPTSQSSTVSSIKDRINRFEAPKTKPKPAFTEARVLLREARKEARKGTLPQLKGEVEYAEIPQVEMTTGEEEAAPAPQPMPAAKTTNQVKANNVRPISPAKPLVTNEVLVISGIGGRVSPMKTFSIDNELESIKKAKERAEASLRGHQAVLEWASKARTKS